jgi:hypothetical protein
MIRAAIMVVALAACRIADLDVTGKRCPCPTGWDCDPRTDTCAREVSSLDDGGLDDGAVDAGAGDGGADLVSGLVAWFELDASSGSVATDSSGHNRHGWVWNTTVSTWQPMGGVQNGALHFAGTVGQSLVVFPSSNGNCPTPYPIASSFTASAYVKFDTFGTWSGYSLSDAVLMQGTSGGLEGGWGLGATDACGNVPRAGITVTPDGSSASRATRCGTTQLSTDVWYHIAGVYDASAQTLDIYLDGVLDTGALAPSSVAIPAQVATPPVCAYIGAPSNQSKNLRGFVDNARLYQRALTPSEIAALVARGG